MIGVIVLCSLILGMWFLIALLVISQEIDKYLQLKNGRKALRICLTDEEFANLHKEIAKKFQIDSFKIFYAKKDKVVIKIKDQYFEYDKNSLKYLFSGDCVIEYSIEKVLNV